VSIAFPSTSPSRVLFKENNGPDVVLTWDIDRPKPARNRRY